MSWKVEWHPKATKNLDSLPPDIKERIEKRVDKLKENPLYFLQHYEGADYYKLRIGDYRALIDVDFRNKVVKIQVFDHRNRIYKRL
ncbi:MAG: type II toxin-antitoxin system RelE/ParE family toxin [Candidatus Aenigmarchaeota archaeon]|nr:type II toxin-antitoxin system RelE/ParE family toxin [Candidatus Aenigmarchaeota archaeon]